MKSELTKAPPEDPAADDGWLDEMDDSLCDCGKVPWDMCDCGAFFLEWMCGMDSHGHCSLAGTEECDWECPRAPSGRRALVDGGEG